MDCCENSGGRLILSINGKRYATQGGATIMPTTTEKSAEANDDGSLRVKTKAVPAEAEFRLTDRCGLNVADIAGCLIDATFELLDMNRTYLFTRATVIGRPTVHTETGEISGIKIATSLATQIDG